MLTGISADSPGEGLSPTSLPPSNFKHWSQVVGPHVSHNLQAKVQKDSEHRSICPHGVNVHPSPVTWMFLVCQTLSFGVFIEDLKKN